MNGIILLHKNALSLYRNCINGERESQQTYKNELHTKKLILKNNKAHPPEAVKKYR